MERTLFEIAIEFVGHRNWVVVETECFVLVKASGFGRWDFVRLVDLVGSEVVWFVDGFNENEVVLNLVK